MRFFRWVCLFLTTCQISLCATERAPWFGRELEVDWRMSCLLEAYRSINTGSHNCHKPSCNAFFDLSAATYCSSYSLEFEAVTAATRHRSFGMDSLLVTGRYRLLNDIIGDPASIVAGLTLSKVFKPARTDPSVFHHGGIQAEAHLSVGKEFSCMQFWTSRIWGVGGVGIADLGSAWLRGDFVWEHNWWDRQQVRLFAHTLWGLGHNHLCLENFHGYGPIRHQSIDIGTRYSFTFDNGLALSAEYAYRVYVKNGPNQANFFLLQLCYPFSIQQLPFASYLGSKAL